MNYITSKLKKLVIFIDIDGFNSLIKNENDLKGLIGFVISKEYHYTLFKVFVYSRKNELKIRETEKGKKEKEPAVLCCS